MVRLRLCLKAGEHIFVDATDGDFGHVVDPQAAADRGNRRTSGGRTTGTALVETSSLKEMPIAHCPLHVPTPPCYGLRLQLDESG